MNEKLEEPDMEETANPLPEPDPGGPLRARREALGLSLEAVAERLRIRPAILRAYEENDFERLPSPPYRLGFLRQYAGLLGLDVEPLVEEFRLASTGSGGDRPRKPSVETTVTNPRPGEKPSMPVWWWWVMAALVLIGLVVLLIRGAGSATRHAGKSLSSPAAAGRSRSPESAPTDPMGSLPAPSDHASEAF